MKAIASVQLRIKALRIIVLFLSLGITAVFSLLFYGIAVNDSAASYLGLALIMAIIPLAVGLLRGRSFDIFEPINVVAAAILFGTTLRAPYLLYSDSPRVDILMMGQRFRDIVGDAGWVTAGIFFLCVGYVIANGRFQMTRFRFISGYTFSLRRLQLCLVLVSAISVVGIAMYVIKFGVDLSNLTAASYKRVAEYVTEDGDVAYGAAGVTGVFGQFAQYGLIVTVGAYFAGYIKPNLQFFAVLAVLVLLSIAIPFLGSSRTVIILMIFSFCTMGYYFGRIKLSAIFVALAAIIGLAGWMGAIRDVNQNDVASEDGTIERLIGSGNGFDAVRSTAIIKRVPEVRPYLYGESYAALGTFFIPRSVWPGKPQTSLGAWVKGDLFGQYVRNAGWPPGAVAEAYINFGYLGIPLVMLLIGAFLRFVYETCLPFLGTSLPVTVLYSALIYRLGFNMIELNVAHALATSLALAGPLLLLLVLVNHPHKGRARQYAPALRQPRYGKMKARVEA